MPTNVTSALFLPAQFRLGGGMGTEMTSKVFADRLLDGYNLSDRIWNLAEYGQNQILNSIRIGLRDGLSAVQISKLAEDKLLKCGPAWTTGIKRSVTGRGSVAYNALRLARTEVNQGYHQMQNSLSEENPLLIGQRWNLSSSHPVYPASAAYEGYNEICNYYAEHDHSGLGEGIFPKGKAPRDHPNGLCYLTDEFEPIEKLDKLLDQALALAEARIPLPADRVNVWEGLDAEDIVNEMNGLAKEIKSNPSAVVKYKTIADRLEDKEEFNFMAKNNFVADGERVCNILVKKWANTSADNDSLSIAMQLAAQKEFGLDSASIWYPPELLARADKWYGQYEAGLRQFLRAQYEVTQEYFRREGITHVTLARGSTYSPHKDIAEYGFKKGTPWDGTIHKDGLKLQPLSSFSSEFDKAYDFASSNTYYNLITVVRVPVEDIIGTGITGMGTNYESEMVVLGKNNWDAYHYGYKGHERYGGSERPDPVDVLKTITKMAGGGK